MPRLTPQHAYDSLNYVEDSIKDIPGAAVKSGRGAPSTLDQITQWRMRISRGDMSPDALPTQYQHQAARHWRRAPRVSEVLRREELALRARQGKRTEYGSQWYFGKHRKEYDD